MIKVKVGAYKSIIKKYQKLIDERTKTSLEKVVAYATKQAQNSYDRFVFEVPADDPYVWVKNTPIVKAKDTTYASSISAIGNQVLFIEFGAGITYNKETSPIVRMYQSFMPNDRPPKIYNIGEYGSGRGKDDVWFYKSKTGRESENAHLIKYNSHQEPIMITHGNRPARALYLGVGMAIRRLLGGRLK